MTLVACKTVFDLTVDTAQIAAGYRECKQFKGLP